MLKNYLKIAWKVLFRKKLYSIIILGSIALTLTILMIIIAIVSQMNTNITRNRENNKLLLLTNLKYTGNSMATMPLSYHFINDFSDKAKLSQKIGCVSVIHIPIDYYKNEKRNTLSLRYVDSNFWDIMKVTFIEGKPFSEEEVSRGDRVIVIDAKTKNLVFGDEKATGKFMELQGQRLLITGVVNNISRLDFLSYGNIWMPITLTEDVNNKNSKGSSFAITTWKHKQDIGKINEALEKYLSKMELPHWHDSVTGYFEIGFWAYVGNMFDVKNIKYWISFSIILLVLFYLLMPIFNLYALFGMRLTERNSEIGLRKAFGAARRTIRDQFIVENLFIVVTGSLIAFVLTIIALNIFNHYQVFPNANLQINLNAFGISLLVSVLFGLLAGYIPSVKISKTTIVETLNTTSK